MKGLGNQTWLWGLIVSNIVAIIYFLTAIKSPRVSRFLFFLLFTWACFANWKVSHQRPEAYLEYANLTFSTYYEKIIQGWFSRNISITVGFIATCQGLVAISMILKGWKFKLGCIGGIIFLVAIAPLGVGSGFPCTLIFAVGMIILYRKGDHFLWSPTNAIGLSKLNNNTG